MNILLRKASMPTISILQKALFLRDFPAYEQELDCFSDLDKFIEILNEYCLCEMKIEKYKRTEEMLESYKQIKKELRIELLNFLNKNSLVPRKNNEDSEI